MWRTRAHGRGPLHDVRRGAGVELEEHGRGAVSTHLVKSDPGPSAGQVPARIRMKSGDPGRRVDRESTASRLLTLQEAAAYLGVSYWTIRSWIERDVIKVVRLPSVRGGVDGRLVRIERAVLDKLIEASSS